MPKNTIKVFCDFFQTKTCYAVLLYICSYYFFFKTAASVGYYGLGLGEREKFLFQSNSPHFYVQCVTDAVNGKYPLLNTIFLCSISFRHLIQFAIRTSFHIIFYTHFPCAQQQCGIHSTHISGIPGP